MKLILSEKGKDFKGNVLDEHNVRSFEYVLYKRKIYRTGNRRHMMLELFDEFNRHFANVNCKSIRLIEYSNK